MKDLETHLVHSFPKTENEEIRVAIKQSGKQVYIDLRIWFKSEEGRELIPTKKGIFCSLACLPELRKGIDRLAKATEKFNRKPENQESLAV